jgi:hypothetical protein
MGNELNPVVTVLLEAGNVDTVYRDVYLGRARTLLAPSLSPEDFHRIEQEHAQLAELPLSIARAMDRANWPLVKELCQRAATLKQIAESKKALTEAGRGVYAVTDIRLDPFSPGLGRFTRVTTKDMPALRTRAVERLSTLEQSDPVWKDFYAGRRAAFQARAGIASAHPDPAGGTTPSEDAREAATQALKAGDLSRLAQLADALITAATPAKSESAPGASAGVSPTPAPRQAGELLVTYSSDTVARARRLGLAPRHMESRAELAALHRYAWTPLLDDPGHAELRQVPPVPAGSPEGFRNRVEMFVIHPLVNSGGARHLPKLHAEDVLVEDFPDSAASDQSVKSELLAALGLPGRRGVPRVAIEQALLTHGAELVEQELGLDPRVFRLVCIPSDVHLRLGEAEGWGRLPFWTHFDGYLVLADGRLRALAGGDVQYGGLNDLLGVSRDYDSDRLVARFAVVHRERMVAW